MSTGDLRTLAADLVHCLHTMRNEGAITLGDSWPEAQALIDYLAATDPAPDEGQPTSEGDPQLTPNPKRTCPVAFTVCSTCRKRVSLDRPDRHVCSTDLPTTVQADRNPGQVRLTEDELTAIRRVFRGREADEAQSLFERILAARLAEVTAERDFLQGQYEDACAMEREYAARLAARQSDPDATEREWGIQHIQGRTQAVSEADALERTKTFRARGGRWVGSVACFRDVSPWLPVDQTGAGK